MYFKDLQEVNGYGGVSFLKIGWLDEGQPYNQGVAPKEFVDKLKQIPLSVHTKGWHTCPFCGNAKSYSQYLIRKDRYKSYDVPEMIIHYMDEHNYLPPQEFIDVVMNIKLVEKPKEEKTKRHFK
jgi:hypothetical protein